jgi:ribosomal protein S18 acetylase RimI-like enzyme
MDTNEASSKPVNRSTTGNIEIREMELEDLPVIFSLGEELFTAEKWPNLYRTWDEYEIINMYASSGEFCLVAESDEKIIGFVLGSLIEKRRSAWVYGYLQWLGVAPEIKGKGVGRKLLNRLTELFIEHGARMMMVDTEIENTHAIRFFKRQGFGNEIEHIYLTRNLSTHPEYLRRKAGKK